MGGDDVCRGAWPSARSGNERRRQIAKEQGLSLPRCGRGGRAWELSSVSRIGMDAVVFSSAARFLRATVRDGGTRDPTPWGRGRTLADAQSRAGPEDIARDETAPTDMPRHRVHHFLTAAAIGGAATPDLREGFAHEPSSCRAKRRLIDHGSGTGAALGGGRPKRLWWIAVRVLPGERGGCRRGRRL